MPTRSAPEAIAFTTSEPRQKPPSTMILGAAFHRVDDFGQRVHGAAAMIELASAMVGDVDPIDAVIERDLCILGGGNALDDTGSELVL